MMGVVLLILVGGAKKPPKLTKFGPIFCSLLCGLAGYQWRRESRPLETKFGKTKGERVEKGDFRGDLGGF